MTERPVPIKPLVPKSGSTSICIADPDVRVYAAWDKQGIPWTPLSKYVIGFLDRETRDEALSLARQAHPDAADDDIYAVDEPATNRAEALLEFPDYIRQLADPWSLYRIKSTGELVIYHRLSEHPDGELTISVIYVDVDKNRKLWGRDVPVDDLELCEPSGTDEEIEGIATARDRGQRLIGANRLS